MSTIERTVWDGSNPLYEIRYPGWDSLSSSQLERDTVLVTDNRQSYGRVAYTHGLGVDRPLNIVRMGFSATWAGPVAVTPLGDMQGIFDLGAFDDGRAKRCTSYTPDTNCINFEWPGQKYGQNPYSKTSPFNQPLTWQGTLVAQRRDLSGQIYLRNRFYDPNTGRFTQEDPIGLAGGLNLYGFANGDPVNFSDPFGLFAGGPCDIPDLKCLSAAVMQRLVNRSVETLDAAPSAAGSAVGLGLPGPASTAVAQVTRNRAAGLLAEGKVARQVVAEGGQVLGRHVTAVTSSGRRVIDILAMAPNGGGLVALEVKSGGATVTFQQALKDLMMATEGARLVGRNAGPLAGQVVQIPTLIVRVP